MRHDLPVHRWRKASHSGAQSGDCLEVQETEDGLVAVGHSKARELGAFTFPHGTWHTFVESVKDGEFG
ncbi:DUF397 domain-containing protein [Streptomyces sp. ALI-76-A]|uniref:DUF397 domain-containing protein n=1 Tax=Streptomyces sp. ALI-76-A TaxID=3025736 RepID=UPI00256F58D4|nr:DUF397 domain-containing protein [Streptomyces sp. ALI-76-A]MDL5199744.1 DUF397 domain-containing protein [Streptomyces sp. ALI-76-A]